MEKKKILIVEDEISLLGILKEKFTKEGFIALEAKNGKEGLKIALSEKPDLILLDIIMPVMDGMTMLGKLRKDKRGKKIPVIFLTNLSNAHEIGITTKALTEGAQDYLVKAEWKINDLVEKVKGYFK